MAIAAFMAAQPGMKLIVPAGKNPKFEAYHVNGGFSTLLKFLEIDPYTWSVPTIERSCVDFDKVVIWTAIRSNLDNFLAYTVIDDVTDGCSVDDDVLAKRTVRVNPPYDRHISEWICGADEMCVNTELSIPTSWKVMTVPRATFSLGEWEGFAHATRGRHPFVFTR
jgi:hypothetical protein